MQKFRPALPMPHFGPNTTAPPYLVGCALLTKRYGSGRDISYAITSQFGYNKGKEVRGLKVAGLPGETQSQVNYVTHKS